MYLQLYMKMEGDPERSNYLQKAKRMIELSLRHMHGGADLFSTPVFCLGTLKIFFIHKIVFLYTIATSVYPG